MKPPPFEYIAPESIEEALAALREHGDEAKVLAGGQSLMPLLAFRLLRPSVLVDLNRVPGLDELRLDKETLVVGAMARQRAVEMLVGLRERCAMVSEAVELVGHVAIRNRGTVGGSLVHADPAAEWAALVVALDGELELFGPSGSRKMAAAEFLITYFTTALAPDELLTRVQLSLPNGRSGSCFLELCRRHGDFAIVGVGAVVTLGANGEVADGRVVLIGIAERAVRATAVEKALAGERPTEQTIAQAVRELDGEISPGSDIHASESYRRQVAAVLTRRALARAAERAQKAEYASEA